ncbi:hypothetical protein BSKO_04037 [Bryopsis sp. KO-2023]|nr:hypothetical protein BSKO_04037 [Bryopsis sp. KO-2023]
MTTVQGAEALEQQVHRVLLSLHATDTASDVRQKAGAWLQEFQSSPLAWQVAHNILLNKNLPFELHLFAAQTLKNKVRVDLGTLGGGHLPQLRDVFLEYIQTHQNGPRPLLVQICLGLSALVLLWDRWVDVLQTVESSIPRECFLVFLTILAEEAVGETWARFSGDLDWLYYARRRVQSWSESVLMWLSRLMSSFSGQDGATSLINCFGAWIRLGALHETPFGTYEALANLCFEKLGADDEKVWEAAGRAIGDLAEFAPPQLLRQLVDKVISIMYKVSGEVTAGRVEDGKCRTLLALFGDCLMGLSEETVQNDRKGELLREALVSCLSLDCMKHPDLMITVLEASTALVDHIACVLSNGKSGAEASHNYMEGAEMRKLLEVIFEKTLPRVGLFCRDPQDLGVAAEAMQELQCHLCDAIGADSYTSFLASFMSVPGNGVNYIWEHLESSLYCSAAIAPAMLQHHNGGKLVSPLLGGVVSIQLPSDPNAAGFLFRAIACAISALAETLMGADRPLQMRQEMFSGFLKLLILGLDYEVSRDSTGVAIQRLFQAAVQSQISIPVACVSSVMEKSKQPALDGRTIDVLVVAVIAALRNVEGPDPALIRQQASQQVLAPIHDVLVSAANQQSLGRDLDSIDITAAKTLNLLKALLEAAALWSDEPPKDDFHQDHEGSKGNPLLWMFVTSTWPQIVHLLLSGLGAESLGLAADCATIALSNLGKVANCILPGLTELCKKRFTDPGGYHLAIPLGVSVEVMAGDQVHIGNLLATIQSIWGFEDVRAMSDPIRADEVGRIATLLNCVLSHCGAAFVSSSVGSLRAFQLLMQLPDFSAAVLNLSGCVARSHTVFPSGSATAIMQHGLESAIQCCRCRHKDIATAAVSCIRSTLYAMADSPLELGTLVVWTQNHGNLLIQGLIGGLLSPAPVARVHKVTGILLLFASMVRTADRQGACPLRGWLEEAFGAYTGKLVPAELAGEAVNAWAPVLEEVWQQGPQFMNNFGRSFLNSKLGRKMKKLIREFAERHIRISRRFPVS